MQISLGFQVAQSGNEIAEPTYWPVYFAVDDGALRFLSGDVVSDWLVAPGPLAKGDVPSWLRDVADRGLAGGGYVGFGLVYSEAGSADDATRAAYQDLIATLHALVLGHAAGASGLDVMLGAFGGGAAFDGKPGQVSLDRLREGLDPNDLSKELDTGLVTGVAAFRSVGDAVLPFTQGVPVVAQSPSSMAGGKPVTTTGGKPVPPVGIEPAAALTAAASHASVVSLLAQPPGRIAVPPVIAQPPVVTQPPVIRPPIVRPPVRVPAIAAGTVVAVTAQAFRLEDIAAKGTLAIDHVLPTRVTLKTSLRLTGSVGRGG